MPKSPPKSRKNLIRRGVPVLLATLLLSAGSIAYARSNSGGNDNFVTSTVSRGNIQQHLDLTGSVKQVNQRSVSFGVSARVASIAVAVGESVAPGQVLATLDTTALKSDVLDTKAGLAQAKASLDTDESSNTSSETSSTTSTPAADARTAANQAVTTDTATSESVRSVVIDSAVSSATSNSAPGTSMSASANDLTQLQRKIVRAQDGIEADLTVANAAMAKAQTACANAGSASSAAASSTATSSGSSTPSASPSGTTSRSSTGADPTTSLCMTALHEVLPAQLKTSKDQAQLSQLTKDLVTSAEKTANVVRRDTGKTNNTKTDASSKANAASSTGTAHTNSATTDSGSGNETATNSGSGTSRSASQSSAQSTAARIITDKADIATAQTALNSANRNLAAAALKAPAGGIVANIGFVKGDTASTTDSVTIVKTGAVTVTIDVPLATIRKVRINQIVHVSADGSTVAVDGKVDSISLLSTSSNGTTSYPVTVLVPRSTSAVTTAALATGARAQVSIVVDSVKNVLTVPNSALTKTATGAATATVVNNGTLTRKTVRTGAVGLLSTEIVSGLTAGEKVLLADRSQSLPTNSTNITTGRSGGVGGGLPAGSGSGGFSRRGGN